jgi:hypothetical protein
MFLLEKFLSAINNLWHMGIPAAFALLIYLIPVFIARARKVKKIKSLSIVSIALGWTFVAWAACIAWAICGEKAE